MYIDAYYKILGIESKATVEEIKQAYRKKAKELHPDKNKNPDASEPFILLTEAYDCLTNIKTGKSNTQPPTESYSDWQRENREQARTRASEYAKMQYEEFKKTDYYKNTQAVITVAQHLYLFSSILIILSPLWGYIFMEWTGFLLGLLFTFLSIQYWAGIFQEDLSINLRSFVLSLGIIVKTKAFIYALITLINLIVFFRFTLNTQMTFSTFAIILFAFYTATYLSNYLKLSFIKRFSKIGIFLCFTPSIFNLLFLTNFIFSANPKTETYSFVHETSWYETRLLTSRGHLEKIAYIDLKDNKYVEYKWFRMFLDFESMKNKSEITYTFEDGLLGMRVLKDYDFTK